MGMKDFKPHFERLYMFEDLLDDFLEIRSFTSRSKNKNFDLFDAITNGKEKVIKNEKEHKYIFTCVGIKKEDLTAEIDNNVLKIQGKSTNIFGETKIHKEILLLPTYNQTKIDIKLEEGILTVTIGLMEAPKIKIDIK